MKKIDTINRFQNDIKYEQNKYNAKQRSIDFYKNTKYTAIKSLYKEMLSKDLKQDLLEHYNNLIAEKNKEITKLHNHLIKSLPQMLYNKNTILERQKIRKTINSTSKELMNLIELKNKVLKMKK